MDIYIVHDGQEMGPFSDNAAREMLAQGAVKENDFAWRAGMEKWVALSELLAAEKAPTPVAGSTPPPPSEGKFEPATPKQKALLSFLGITFPADLSRDQAARRVNDAMEDSANAERLKLWNEERLRLHPELFAAEIQAKKENRANQFLELCQTTGAKYFSGISKAHCQVLVGFLDVKFPNWDSRDSEAAEYYFFPAVAEKFPQLVHKQWRGRLRYAEGLKVAPEIVSSSRSTRVQTTATSPLVAVARGLALGLIILAVLYLGYRTIRTDVTAAPASPDSATPASGGAAEPAAPVVAATDAAPVAPESAPAVAGTTTPPEKLPSIDPLPPVAPVAPVVPVEPAPAPAVAALPGAIPPPGELPTVTPPGLPAPAVAAADPTMAPPMAIPPVPPPAALPGLPAVPGLPPSPADPAAPSAPTIVGLPPSPPVDGAVPGMPSLPGPPPSPPADPTAATPPGVPSVPSVPGLPPSPPADAVPPMATLPPTPPPPAALPGMTPPVDPVTGMPPAVPAAPVATLPGMEPPVPVAPPPATLPVAGTLPTAPPAATPPVPADPAVPGLPPSPPAVPGVPPTVPGLPPSPEAPAVPVAKTNLVLTKVVEVQLTYGKITLRPGTAVKLISRQGQTVRVSYGGNVINVPVSSTDLE